MDLEFSETEAQLRRELRQFLKEELPPHWPGLPYEGNADVAQQVCHKMGERRWLTRHWPREFGGEEASVWEQVVVQEEMWAHHEPRGGQYMGVNWIGPALMHFGTQEQLETFLPSIASGDAEWAQLFSETEAGSDLSSIRTTAIVDGHQFLVDGEKMWTSYANLARWGFLLARSDSTCQGRSGLSVLLVDMEAPGVDVREIPSSIGWHRLHSVRFDRVQVPLDRLLGPLNEGWDVAMKALSFERAGSARYAQATRILWLLNELVGEGLDGTSGDERANAWALGRVAELMNYRVVDMKQRGEEITWQGSAARVYNVMYESAVAEVCERQLGPSSRVAYGDPHAPSGGEIEAFVARTAPIGGIAGGTREIQMSIIAERGLGLPRTR